MQEVGVVVRPDFLERQAKVRPVRALADLIWNGLNADAPSINVEIQNDGFGGVPEVVGIAGNA